MPKLTKTEEKILAAAKRNPRGMHAEVWTTGHGPAGGRVNYGSRAFIACRKLVKRGLAEQVGDIHRSSHARNGWMEHDSEIVIQVPVND